MINKFLLPLAVLLPWMGSLSAEEPPAVEETTADEPEWLVTMADCRQLQAGSPNSMFCSHPVLLCLAEDLSKD